MSRTREPGTGDSCECGEKESVGKGVDKDNGAEVIKWTADPERWQRARKLQ